MSDTLFKNNYSPIDILYKICCMTLQYIEFNISNLLQINSVLSSKENNNIQNCVEELTNKKGGVMSLFFDISNLLMKVISFKNDLKLEEENLNTKNRYEDFKDITEEDISLMIDFLDKQKSKK